MRCVCCVSRKCPLLYFPAKKPLTNAAFWRIIKVKREHTSRRSAPMLSYQEITVQVSSSGRLFPFIVVVMENIVHQCYNSNDQDTDCTESNLTKLRIPYHSLPNVKCRLLFSGKSKLQTQKRGQPSTGLSSLLYSTYFMPLVCQGIFCAVLPLIFF